MVRILTSPLLVPVLSLAYLFALAAWEPGIVSPRNLRALLLDMLPLYAAAIGMTIVVITGGIDLSITAVISLASVAGATLVTADSGPLAAHPLGIPAALAAMMVVGLIAGALHGAAVAWLQMPPFLVTLASLLTLSGLTVWWTKATPLSNLPEGLVDLYYGHLGPIPYPVLLVGSLALFAAFLLRRTAFGWRLYAIGQNAQAARVSGVPVERTLLIAYIASGLCASVAALLYMAKLETGHAELVAKDLLLDCIGAVVLGGASLSGGRGTVVGTLFGAFLITLVANSLDMLNLGFAVVIAVKGGVILLAALFDVLRQHESPSQRPTP